MDKLMGLINYHGTSKLPKSQFYKFLISSCNSKPLVIILYLFEKNKTKYAHVGKNTVRVL